MVLSEISAPQEARRPRKLGFGIWAILMLTAGCSSSLNEPLSLADLDNPDPVVKFRAFKWAGDSKEESAVPQLVDMLEDEDDSVRFFAIQTLRRITGTDNGYDYKAAPHRRAEAVKRWREYLKQRQIK